MRGRTNTSKWMPSVPLSLEEVANQLALTRDALGLMPSPGLLVPLVLRTPRKYRPAAARTDAGSGAVRLHQPGLRGRARSASGREDYAALVRALGAVVRQDVVGLDLVVCSPGRPGDNPRRGDDIEVGASGHAQRHGGRGSCGTGELPGRLAACSQRRLTGNPQMR